MIIPVQEVSVISSSFSKPQLIVPSPTPFWPCSSSSNKRNVRGTTTERIKGLVELVTVIYGLTDGGHFLKQFI